MVIFYEPEFERVIPAEAGIEIFAFQNAEANLDTGLRRCDDYSDTQRCE